MDNSKPAVQLPEQAPVIVHELRAAFDSRLIQLWNDVLRQPPTPPTEGLDRTVHVFFTHGSLEVTAVYNSVTEQFTQLIARHADEVGLERPSFTISLFL
jgi:hypothetical protein